jgi:hypothetical protein
LCSRTRPDLGPGPLLVPSLEPRPTTCFSDSSNSSQDRRERPSNERPRSDSPARRLEPFKEISSRRTCSIIRPYSQTRQAQLSNPFSRTSTRFCWSSRIPEDEPNRGYLSIKFGSLTGGLKGKRNDRNETTSRQQTAPIKQVDKLGGKKWPLGGNGTMVSFVVFICAWEGGIGIGSLVQTWTRWSRNRAGFAGQAGELLQFPSNKPCTATPTVPVPLFPQMDRRPTLDGTPLPPDPEADRLQFTPLGRPVRISPHLDKHTRWKHPQTPPSTWLFLFCCRSPHHPHSSEPNLSLICQCLDGADNIPPIQTLSSCW